MVIISEYIFNESKYNAFLNNNYLRKEQHKQLISVCMLFF